jgi:hypothetical protein
VLAGIAALAFGLIGYIAGRSRTAPAESVQFFDPVRVHLEGTRRSIHWEDIPFNRAIARLGREYDTRIMFISNPHHSEPLSIDADNSQLIDVLNSLAEIREEHLCIDVQGDVIVIGSADELATLSTMRVYDLSHLVEMGNQLIARDAASLLLMDIDRPLSAVSDNANVIVRAIVADLKRDPRLDHNNVWATQLGISQTSMDPTPAVCVQETPYGHLLIERRLHALETSWLAELKKLRARKP